MSSGLINMPAAHVRCYGAIMMMWGRKMASPILESCIIVEKELERGRGLQREREREREREIHTPQGKRTRKERMRERKRLRRKERGERPREIHTQGKRTRKERMKEREKERGERVIICYNSKLTVFNPYQPPVMLFFVS